MDTAWIELSKALAPLVGVLVTGIGAVGAWVINEKRKRASEEYQRKEERYRELLGALRGFYITDRDPRAVQTFLDQLNLCWLYCPDNVIRSAYAFVDTVSTGVLRTDEEKELAVGELVAAIRHDLVSRRIVKRTRLSAADFRHLAASDLGISPPGDAQVLQSPTSDEVD